MQQIPVTFATFAHIALAPAYVLEGSLGKGTYIYTYTIFACPYLYRSIYEFIEAQHILAKVHVYVYRIFACIHMYIDVYVIYREPAYISRARAYTCVGRQPWQRNIYLYTYLNCKNVNICMCMYECIGPSICIWCSCLHTSSKLAVAMVHLYIYTHAYAYLKIYIYTHAYAYLYICIYACIGSSIRMWCSSLHMSRSAALASVFTHTYGMDW